MALLYLLTVAVSGLYMLLLLFYLYGWIKTTDHSSTTENGNLPSATFVSIVIAARNEEHNILTCLASIYKQTYPMEKFEVIVCNDHSTDNTAKILESLPYPNLRIITMHDSSFGKKQAIAEGIKSAKGNLIMMTDADCEVGEKWLMGILSFYETKKYKMIVAPVLLRKGNGFQQYIQSRETLVLTASACASLYWNIPVLCNGANLAFEKSAFMEVNGFDGVNKTATGDDIFLMLKMHKKFPGQIGYLKSKGAMIVTHPQQSVFGALKQRKRWASKNLSYGFSSITGIAVLVFLMNLTLLLYGILSVINIKFTFALLLCFSIKYIVDFMLLFYASTFFGKKVNPLLFGLASLLYPVYVVFIGIIAPFTTYSWKERKS